MTLAIDTTPCPHPAKGTAGGHHWRPEYRVVKGEAVGSMVCAYCGAKQMEQSA